MLSLKTNEIRSSNLFYICIVCHAAMAVARTAEIEPWAIYTPIPPQCPSPVEDSRRLKPYKMREEVHFTVFFDYTIETDKPVDDNVTVALMNVITTTADDYMHCACGESEASITGLVALDKNDNRRKLRKYRNTKNYGVSGKYRPPPGVDPTGLVKDSIGRGRGRRRLSETYDSSCNVVNDESMSDILNDQEVFDGEVYDAYLEEDTVMSCYDNADICVDNISPNITTSCNVGYQEESLCQLDCCCMYPEAQRCKDIAYTACGTMDAMCIDVEFYVTLPPTPVKNKKIDIIIP